MKIAGISDLVSDFNKGNERAFNEIYSIYFQRLYVFAFRLIDNGAEAEDIIIQTFYKLHKSRGNFISQNSLEAFLFVCTRNACLDHFKLQHRSIERQKKFIALAQEDQDMENSQIEGEKIAAIYRSMEILSGQCRRVLEMIYIEGYKYREVAEELGISIDTAKSYRKEAIDKLRKVLSEKYLLSAWISYLVLTSHPQMIDLSH